MAGRRPVEEAFVAGRPARRLLVTPARRQALERIVLHATRLRIPIVEVEGGTLTAIAGFDGHQGVALVVEPRRFAKPEEILARAAERNEPPFVLVVDSLEDPQNLGTLLRSAEAAGVHGVLFPIHHQAPLTPAAIKASAGAVEHLLLAPVADLAGALADLHIRGLRVVGSDAEAPLTARQADLRGPLALVVGSEGRGLGAAVRRRCDLLIRIPMRGAVGSLNAAVAGSVLLFEAVAQRDPEGRSAPPRPVPEGDIEAAHAEGEAPTRPGIPAPGADLPDQDRRRSRPVVVVVPMAEASIEPAPPGESAIEPAPPGEADVEQAPPGVPVVEAAAVRVADDAASNDRGVGLGPVSGDGAGAPTEAASGGEAAAAGPDPPQRAARHRRRKETGPDVEGLLPGGPDVPGSDA